MAIHSNDPPHIERKSLCLPSTHPGVAMHSGDAAFSPAVSRLYSSPENDAAETLMRLKAELRNAEPEAFWTRLMEGMTEVCDAQYGLVAKRILPGDPESAVEMPPIGEPGSCCLGVAYYYNDGKQNKAMHRDCKFLAWGSPCAHMKHDKVFLVPERMSDFLLDNPNKLPFTAEGYLGVPLFFDGMCFAHFGIMWTQDGLDRRKLSWGTLEMIMHSLEDMIVYRLINGQSFVKTHQQNRPVAQTITPPEPVSEAAVAQQVISATQSLKPYAKSLSHELRTPMHGVVGMLDVMHATVQEQIEGSSNAKARQVFQTLRDNIETVQDSSKRAVEAADNVVHAYDMNMQIPDTPMNETDSPATAASATTTYFDYKPSRLIEGSNISAKPGKRRRSDDHWHFGSATKVRQVQGPVRRDTSPPAMSPRQLPPPSFLKTPDAFVRPDPMDSAARLEVQTPEQVQTPGLRQSAIRQIIPIVIQDSLRLGGRPDSAISEPTDIGERIEVRARSSNGEVSQKTIEWSVDEEVPEALSVDERDLTKLISSVFLNSVKFTVEGRVTLTVKLSKSRKFLIVRCLDNGDGIPEDFQPQLFKAFSREDDSTTRSKEGLGLGLLVAKGLARRIGGDLSLIRSATSGPQKGSEFEIRVPLEPDMTISRTGTPVARTPEPMRPHGSTYPPIGSATPQLSSSIMYLNRNLSSPLLPTSAAKENVRRQSITKLNGLEQSAVPHQLSLVDTRSDTASPAPRPIHSVSKLDTIDRNLATKYPLTFLIAEDNKINRKLLVSMLGKLGYKDVYEAFDGREAVRIMAEILHQSGRRKNEGGAFITGNGNANDKRKAVDVVLMDLWMPEMDGYAATTAILEMFNTRNATKGAEGRRHSNAGLAIVNGDPTVDGVAERTPKILAVSADVTDEAIEKATRIGMEGFMTKPYRIADLQRLIVEFCVR